MLENHDPWLAGAALGLLVVAAVVIARYLATRGPRLTSAEEEETVLAYFAPPGAVLAGNAENDLLQRVLDLRVLAEALARGAYYRGDVARAQEALERAFARLRERHLARLVPPPAPLNDDGHYRPCPYLVALTPLGARTSLALGAREGWVTTRAPAEAS